MEARQSWACPRGARRKSAELGVSAGSKEEAGGFLGGRGSRGGGAAELGVSAWSKEDAQRSWACPRRARRGSAELGVSAGVKESRRRSAELWVSAGSKKDVWYDEGGPPTCRGDVEEEVVY